MLSEREEGGWSAAGFTHLSLYKHCKFTSFKWPPCPVAAVNQEGGGARRWLGSTSRNRRGLTAKGHCCSGLGPSERTPLKTTRVKSVKGHLSLFCFSFFFLGKVTATHHLRQKSDRETV